MLNVIGCIVLLTMSGSVTALVITVIIREIYDIRKDKKE